MERKIELSASEIFSLFLDREIRISEAMNDRKHIIWLQTLKSQLNIFLDEYQYLEGQVTFSSSDTSRRNCRKSKVPNNWIIQRSDQASWADISSFLLEKIEEASDAGDSLRSLELHALLVQLGAHLCRVRSQNHLRRGRRSRRTICP